jgi:uncharacterized protein
MTPPQFAGFNILLPIDSISKTIIQNLFVGKFYAIFSMLFGLSFYLILDGKKESSSLKFAWRLLLLFVIGYFHHIHYRGDFLTVYAVFGLALIPFRKFPTKLILVLGLFFALNGPSIILKTISLTQPPIQLTQPVLISPNPVEMAVKYFQMILNGDYQELLISNSTIGCITKYNYLKFSGRLWVIPGLFLLGLWVGRKKWHENIEKIPLIKLIFVTAIFGIPLVFINSYFSTPNNSEIVRYFASIAKDASNILMPLLYIGLILLLYKSKITERFIKQLIPVGKMGLTTYVLQSAFGIFIFYGYGLGLLLKISGTTALGLGLLFFIIQILFSKWWFRNYKFGPLEWLWRSGTNGSWQSIKISKTDIHIR